MNIIKIFFNKKINISIFLLIIAINLAFIILPCLGWLALFYQNYNIKILLLEVVNNILLNIKPNINICYSLAAIASS